MHVATAIDPAKLPDDTQALKALVVDLATKLESLTQQFLTLRRAHFGQSAEHLSGQAELFSQTATVPVPPEQTQTITYERKSKGRPALPADLPRVTVLHDLNESRKAEFHSLQRIGEERREMLNYTPPRLEVIEHVRFKYAGVRKVDGERTVVVADMPAQPLPKANATHNLLAYVLVSKYQDHLPLHRIERILGRHGAPIARATLCDWVLGCAELLDPIYQHLVQHVLAAPKLHIDDTILPLQDPEKSRTVQARAWAYLGAGSRLNDQQQWGAHPAAVVYDFTDTRRGEHVREFLRNYSGYIQVDAYAGYEALFDPRRRPGPIIEIACAAHARRKFFDVVAAQPKAAGPPSIAAQALVWIGRLYDIERDIRQMNPDEKRKARQLQALPILRDYKTWLESSLIGLLPKSPTAAAIHYTLSNWQALVRYCDDGILDIDNNACERAIRPIAMGRRAWLFVGSPRGGKAATTLFSLIETAKLHSVEPYAYLTDVLRRLPEHPANRIDQLLPFNWSPP